MEHSLYRVKSYEKQGAFTLRITFDDDSVRVIDFKSILRGPLYGPLLDEDFFDKVSIDPEVHTLVWPNGADFDPLTLHDWPQYERAMMELVVRSEEKVKCKGRKDGKGRMTKNERKIYERGKGA